MNPSHPIMPDETLWFDPNVNHTVVLCLNQLQFGTVDMIKSDCSGHVEGTRQPKPFEVSADAIFAEIASAAEFQPDQKCKFNITLSAISNTYTVVC